jgi:hypothetical protein
VVGRCVIRDDSLRRANQISAIGWRVEMTRRSDPIERTGPESSPRGRLDPLPLRDASRKRVARGPSGVSPDAASPEPDLLTDAQLAVRWQLSRGTLANQRSGPSQVGRPGPISPLGYRSLRAGRIRVAGASRNYLFR